MLPGLPPCADALLTLRREPLPGLVAVRIETLDTEARVVTLQLGGASVAARIDPALDLAVLRTAIERGERVIAQPAAGDWVVLGGLRTQATPGVDEAEEYAIRAGRVKIHAAHEVALRAGEASLVMRATGIIETLSRDITTRARAVHKIVGRLVRLN